jgi:hypothetical protein
MFSVAVASERKQKLPKDVTPLSAHTRADFFAELETALAAADDEMKQFIKIAKPSEKQEKDIEKQIHFIWIGGPIYGEFWENIKNVTRAAQSASHLQGKYTVNVWVDDIKNLKFLKQKTYIDLDPEFYRTDDPLENIRQYKTKTDKKIQGMQRLISSFIFSIEDLDPGDNLDFLTQGILKGGIKARGLGGDEEENQKTFISMLKLRFMEELKNLEIGPEQGITPYRQKKRKTYQDVVEILNKEYPYIQVTSPLSEDLVVVKNSEFGTFPIKIRFLDELRDISKRTLGENSRYFWSMLTSETVGFKNFGTASDFLRLLILYKEGGIYLDTDTARVGGKITKNELMTINFPENDYFFGFKVPVGENILGETYNNAPLISSASNPIMKYMLFKALHTYFSWDQGKVARKRNPFVGQEKRGEEYNKLTIDLGPGIVVETIHNNILPWLEKMTDVNDISFCLTLNSHGKEFEKYRLSHPKASEDLIRKGVCIPKILSALTIPYRNEEFQIGNLRLKHYFSKTWVSSVQNKPRLFKETGTIE